MNRLVLLFLAATMLPITGFASAPAFAKTVQGHSIAILPLADYSESGSLATTWQHNQIFQEQIVQQLTSRGNQIIQPDQVLDLLVQEEVISLKNFEPNNVASLRNELSNDWSGAMKDELRRYIHELQIERYNQVTATPGHVRLDKQILAKLGRTLNSDYILRGRVQIVSNHSTPEWMPWHQTLLPFVSNGTDNHLAFGFADSANYDQWPTHLNDQASPDNPAGQIYRHGLASDDNIAWSTEKNPEIPAELHLQMRLWLQEAMSGRILWSNQTNLSLTAESVSHGPNDTRLTRAAISQAVDLLTEDLSRTAWNPTPMTSPPMTISADPGLLNRIKLLEQENQALTQQAQTTSPQNSQGLDKQSCWVTATGKPDYLFDLTLTSNGIIIHTQPQSHRIQERQELPLQSIGYNQELSPVTFRQATRPIFDWGVQNNCRFFTKITDATAAREKITYKHLLRVVNEHFYTYEPIN